MKRVIGLLAAMLIFSLPSAGSATHPGGGGHEEGRGTIVVRPRMAPNRAGTWPITRGWERMSTCNTLDHE
jgi:hypothetical protein